MEGDDPGEVNLLAGDEAAEEPLECDLVSSTEFCRLPFHLDCAPFTYGDCAKIVLLEVESERLLLGSFIDVSESGVGGHNGLFERDKGAVF